MSSLDDQIPSEPEILGYLQGQNFTPVLIRAETDDPELTLAEMQLSWARSLYGLPWRYVRAVVQISLVSKAHPIGVMGVASRFSKDSEFVAAAERQIERSASS